jgi:2'-hydroxybiphenyl-2-sulfinate desulfinase
MSIKEVHYTICPVGNASYIAANKNFIKDGLGKLGVTPIKLQTLEPELWKTHFTYRNDILFREGGNIPPLWAKSNDAEVTLIGLRVLDQKQYIIVRAGSDIDTIEQLRKRKIGIPVHKNAIIDFHRASAEHGFKIALSARGVSEKEVDIVELLEEGDFIPKTQGKRTLGLIETEALDSGEADAIYVRGTRSQQLLDTGKYKAIFEIHANPGLLAPINNEQPNTLTVSHRLAEERPEVVVEYVKQVILAAEWAKTNYNEVLNLFAEQTFGTPGQVASAYSLGFHKNLTPELSEQSLSMLEGQKRFLFDRGYLKKDFQLEKWADSSFLKAAWAEINVGKDKEV